MIARVKITMYASDMCDMDPELLLGFDADVTIALSITNELDYIAMCSTDKIAEKYLQSLNLKYFNIYDDTTVYQVIVSVWGFILTNNREYCCEFTDSGTLIKKMGDIPELEINMISTLIKSKCIEK